MTNKYWVGGSGNWDGTTTHWSLSDGGASGAAIPSSSDDVFFTSLSGAGTVTVSASNTGAKSITSTGSTITTFAGSTAISISGSIDMSGFSTISYSGNMSLIATGSVTWGGRTPTAALTLTINGSGITVTLVDAMSFTSASSILALTQGTFNYTAANVSVGTVSASNSNTRAFVGAAGTSISLSGTGTIWTTSTSTNLTLTNVNVISTDVSASSKTFTGTAAFYYRSLTVPASAGIFNISNAAVGFTTLILKPGAQMSIAGNGVTIDTLDASALTPGGMGSIISSSRGTQRTITVTGASTVYSMAFQDIAITGAGSIIAYDSANIYNNAGIAFRGAAADIIAAMPTASQNADALLDRANGIETGYTLRQALRLMASALLGKASGLATTTAVYRDLPDTKARVTATVDADGNRPAVTLDAA